MALNRAVSLVLMALSQTAVSVPTLALPDHQDALAFHASLSASRITSGSPFVLRYEISNRSSEVIEPDWERERTSFDIGRIEMLPWWVSIRVEDSTGQPVLAQSDLRFKHIAVGSGIGAMPPILLPPGQERKGEIVLSRWFFLTNPGTYRVTIEPHLKYTAAKSEVWALKNTVSFDIRVLPQNDIVLRNIGAKLRDEILTSTDSNARNFGIQKLFAMPQDVALPIWRQLLSDSRLTANETQYALAQLARRDSIYADTLRTEVFESRKSKRAN